MHQIVYKNNNLRTYSFYGEYLFSTINKKARCINFVYTNIFTFSIFDGQWAHSYDAVMAI